MVMMMMMMMVMMMDDDDDDDEKVFETFKEEEDTQMCDRSNLSINKELPQCYAVALAQSLNKFCLKFVGPANMGP
eukprot:3057018-Amphidinium_carterae.1